MNQSFLDYYRCPDRFADFKKTGEPMNGRPNSFPFDADLVRYGIACTQGEPARSRSVSSDQSRTSIDGATCVLRFNPTEVANNLRHERYVSGRKAGWKNLVRETYYMIRPGLPVAVRRHLQSIWLKGREKNPFPHWPVDRTVDQMFERLMAVSLQAHHGERIPFVWFWPEGKSSCAIMTHDVETAAGLAFVPELMDMDDSMGIRSSFQIIPESRYAVGDEILSQIRQRGFEINVHDLKHDGHLFDEPERFREKAERINGYAARFGSRGFRSGVLYRRLDWYGAFDFSYDMSVPNVGHLDPQPGGCCTVMPFYVGNILELPLTTIQDYSLFNILGTHSTDLWQQQIDLIMKGHGLMSFNVHPDYLDTGRAKSAYKKLLHTLANLRDASSVWIPLPREVDTWWRQRSQMRVVADGRGWRIQGPGAERARLAVATLAEDSIRYSLA
jgi:hypothetical protein